MSPSEGTPKKFSPWRILAEKITVLAGQPATDARPSCRHTLDPGTTAGCRRTATPSRMWPSTPKIGRGMIRLETLIELKFLNSSFSSLSSYIEIRQTVTCRRISRERCAHPTRARKPRATSRSSGRKSKAESGYSCRLRLFGATCSNVYRNFVVSRTA